MVHNVILSVYCRIVGCVVSGKHSLMNIFPGEEERCQQRENVKSQLQDLWQEQQNHREQLGDLVKEMQNKILDLERKNQERVIPIPGEPVGTVMRDWERVVYKISKAPELPKFSGIEPTPREEGSFEQWYFQVNGSQSQHTEDAIRSGIINSIRGEARDLVEYVGFDAPIETILDRLEHRFQKSKSTDQLQHDFFQLAQERSEGVQQYAGRLENQYKRLKAAFPDRYGDGQLKERLFFGMIPGLRNATRYVYKKADTTYEELLDMAKEAELEFLESKGVSARMKSVGVVEKTETSKLQELNNQI